MSNELRTTLVLDADLAEALDTYWHTERLSSRNEAIREILRDRLAVYLLPRRVPWLAKPAKEQRR